MPGGAAPVGAAAGAGAAAAAAAAPPPVAPASKQDMLRKLIPSAPIPDALQAIALAEPIVCGQAQHFAGQLSTLVRRANEDYPSWSEEWKIMFVIGGLDEGYVDHEIGKDHSGCRRWVPYADCAKGEGFFCPSNTPWDAYESPAYPAGMVKWLSLLLRSWIFSPYIQQRVAEVILYVRSSVPESFFHRLRINVPKAHHTTDFGMAVGGTKSCLDHNELKRDKVLCEIIETTKYHRAKGIKTMRARAPAERVWAEEGPIEIFDGIPQRVALGFDRIKKASKSKKRRLGFAEGVENDLKQGKTPKRRREGVKSRPIQNIEPSSTLRLETDAGGSRLQNKVVEPVAAGAGAEAPLPMYPFKAPPAVRGGAGRCLPPLHHGKLRLRCSWSWRNQRCDRLSLPSSLIIIEFRFDVPLFGIHNHTSVTPHHYAAM